MHKKTTNKKESYILCGLFHVSWTFVLRFYSTGQFIKLIYFIILNLLLFSRPLFAQPGGGGGLSIGSLYDEKLERIDFFSDSSIKIRTFILNGEKIHQETFLFQRLLNQKVNRAINSLVYKFLLPPSDDIDVDGYLDNQSNQRMFILRNQDTMIIDFVGIIGENPAGIRDLMDSLVIQKGYFKFYRFKNTESLICDDFHKNRRLIGNGLTPTTVKHLSCEGYLEHNLKIDLSFLLDKNLPPSYFLKRAAYYLRYNQPELALIDIGVGIEKSNGTINCEMQYLFCTAYSQTGQYEKAIKNISDAIHCKQYNWDEEWESKVRNYETRIDLFINMKKYEKALEDYDTIYSISQYKIGANIERANFKMKYLKDYKGAILDLKITIDSIPDNHLNDRPQGSSEYADTYFTLAMAEYLNNEKKIAFKHWLKSEEFGYNKSSSNGTIIHFDSIIKQNPKAPELYLSRAIEQFGIGFYLGMGEETKKCFYKALDDINKAEELKMKSYRINMYRASVLNQLKKHEDALKEIDKAILKNNKDPRCFLIRYQISKSETDLQQYKILSQNWKWEKY